LRPGGFARPFRCGRSGVGGALAPPTRRTRGPEAGADAPIDAFAVVMGRAAQGRRAEPVAGLDDETIGRAADERRGRAAERHAAGEDRIEALGRQTTDRRQQPAGLE